MTDNQYAAIITELGRIKGDLAFFEHHNLNTAYRSREHHTRVEQSRRSIQRIRELLKDIRNIEK